MTSKVALVHRATRRFERIQKTTQCNGVFLEHHCQELSSLSSLGGMWNLPLKLFKVCYSHEKFHFRFWFSGGLMRISDGSFVLQDYIIILMLMAS